MCWTPPTLWRGRLFVRNQSQAVCLFLGPREALDADRTPAPALPQSLSCDWTWLLSREADYPHDEPSPGELLLWFGWCLAIFAAAGGTAGLVGFLAWAARSRRPGLWARTTFATAAFLFGLAGTTVLSMWTDAFVLTWPVSLFVAFRVTLGVVVWTEAQPPKLRPRWLSRMVTLLFLAICFGYYHLCLAVGYVMAWGFLAGFLPAAPAAILSVRARKPWLRPLADIVAFTVYFWVSGMTPAWKARWF